MNKMLLVAGAAFAVISTASIASVTYDEGGYGFVGKGDVQTAYGWNNAKMQREHLSISFYFESTLSYDVTCEWTTETGGKNSKTINHEVELHKDLSSTAAVDSASRKTGQYTGWFLNGVAGGDTLTLPAVGDACPPGGSTSENDPPANDAVVTAVDVGDSSNELYASHPTDGDRVLPLTPVI